MNTLKTAVVVVVLLAVLYGVYRVLNMPDPMAWQNEFLRLPPTTSSNPDSAIPIALGQPSQVGPPGQVGPVGPWGAPSQIGQANQPQQPTPWSQPSPGGQPVDPKWPTNSQSDSARSVTPPVQALVPDQLGRTSGLDSSLRPEPSPRQPTERDNTELARPDVKPSPTDVSPTDVSPTDVSPTDVSPTDISPTEREPTASASGSAMQGDVPESALRSFDGALQQAHMQINEGRFRDALANLSVYYNLPGLTQSRHQQLLAWLDPLAGKVIYSNEHRLEDPYLVRSGETLEDIAKRYDVPWELLYNINRAVISDPKSLLPGTELKVVRGPFRAQVSLEDHMLTLFLGELYAGRFDITVGEDLPLRPGMYTVKNKQRWREYTTRTGQTIPAGHPANPFGEYWLDLGSEVSIHGMAELDGTPGPTGCISVRSDDAADVYGILSQGSRVEIRR